MAVPMSAHRNGHPLRLAVILVGLMAVLPLAAWVNDSDVMPVRTIRITGDAPHVDVARLQTHLASAVDGNFLFVDVARVSRAAQALPWVAGAEVRRIWPDTLEVVLRERTPVARWGEQALVDEQGVVFRPRELPALAEELPRLDGPAGTEALLLATHARLEMLLSGTGLRLTALTLNARRAWQGTLNNGIRLQLGRGDPLARMQRFAALYPHILSPRAAQIERVDLRYTNGLAVRWKDGTTDTP